LLSNLRPFGALEQPPGARRLPFGVIRGGETQRGGRVRADAEIELRRVVRERQWLAREEIREARVRRGDFPRGAGRIADAVQLTQQRHSMLELARVSPTA
jgi:hypothetical protein